MTGKQVRAVFIGDSITELWQVADPALFGADVVNRGLGGQVSAQVLLRFYQDAIGLKPRVIHLMVGVNDISRSRSPSGVEGIRNNIRAMADIAQANGIPMIIGSITPVRNSDDGQQAVRIAEFNRWLRAFAAERSLVYADYHGTLAQPSGEICDAFTTDGLHLSDGAYRAIRPILDDAIVRAEGLNAETGPGKP